MNENIVLKFHRPLMDYITYFEKLSPRTIKLLEKVAAPYVYFKDPFNEVHGIERMMDIFVHMFETLNAPKFKVTDYGFGQENAAFLKWRFSFVMNGVARSFDGTSELVFNDQGLVISHVDYWDAAEHVYEHVPLLGSILRFVKKKLSIN